MKLLTALTIVTLSATSFADTLIVTANPTSWSPDVVNCVPGDILRFEYGTGYPHTITSGTSCTYDGLYFNEPLSSPGDFYEFTVPDDGTTEIPFFCAPHCNNGMTGVIMIDEPQESRIDVGVVNIVNPDPFLYTRVGTTETISIGGGSNLNTSFTFAVEIEDYDAEVTVTATTAGTAELLLYDPALETDTPLSSGPLTLLSGNRYAFHGYAGIDVGEFLFELSWEENGMEEGANFTGMYLAGEGSLVGTGDTLMLNYGNPEAFGNITFEGEGEISMTVVGNASSTTLTLPPDAEEGVVTIPAGSHDINFNGFAMFMLNDGNEDDGDGGIPEDVNGDCVVDVSDLLQIIGVWGSTCP